MGVHTAITNYSTSGSWYGQYTLIPGNGQSTGDTVSEAHYTISAFGGSSTIIKYDFTSQKWIDSSTSQPNELAGANSLSDSMSSLTWSTIETPANPEFVFIANSGTDSTFYHAFENPYFSSSSGSGGGTSTEGSTAPSGSTYINSQGQIVFVINSSSPSSDGNVVYKIYRRPIGSALEQAYVVPHTSGSSTEWTIGLNYSLYDLWELRVESSTALVQSGILASYSTVKKVFSNFW